MQLEDKALLHDVLVAAERIQRFTDGKDFSNYLSDDMLRAAVERQFEIIGEALNQLRRSNPSLADGISEHQRIIAFRNILIHGYAQVDDRMVWSVVDDKLETLTEEVNRLLSN